MAEKPIPEFFRERLNEPIEDNYGLPLNRFTEYKINPFQQAGHEYRLELIDQDHRIHSLMDFYEDAKQIQQEQMDNGEVEIDITYQILTEVLNEFQALSNLHQVLSSVDQERFLRAIRSKMVLMLDYSKQEDSDIVNRIQMDTGNYRPIDQEGLYFDMDNYRFIIMSTLHEPYDTTTEVYRRVLHNQWERELATIERYKKFLTHSVREDDRFWVHRYFPDQKIDTNLYTEQLNNLRETSKVYRHIRRKL